MATTDTVTHTPGPWRFDRAGDSRIMSAGTPSLCVALITRGVDMRPDLETLEGPTYEANARLIAAAPDLLAVVKKMQHALVRCELDPVDNNYTSILEQAELAIAKAEGR